MANKTIGQLDSFGSGATLSTDDLLAVFDSQTGSTKKASIAQVKAGMGIQQYSQDGTGEGSVVLGSTNSGNTITLNKTNSLVGGLNSTVSAENSLVFGSENTASGINTVALNQGTTASGNSSIAIGLGTIAQGDDQLALGKYNIADDTSNYAEVVGNGNSASNRSNARVLDWDGNERLAGTITINNGAGIISANTEGITLQLKNGTQIVNSLTLTPNGLTATKPQTWENIYANIKAALDSSEDRIPTIFSGTANPSSSTGNNGDLYIQYEES